MTKIKKKDVKQQYQNFSSFSEIFDTTYLLYSYGLF